MPQARRSERVPATEPEGGFAPVPAPDQTSALRRPGPQFPQWGSSRLDLPVVVALSTEAASRVEAVMIARREALDQAERRMADYVAQLPTPDGANTVGGLLSGDRALADRLEERIRSSIETPAQGEIEGGRYALRARLALEPIALEIWGEEVPTAPSADSPRPVRPRVFEIEPQGAGPSDMKMKAHQAALENARRELLERLKRESLFPNYTIEDLMLADDEASRQVRAAVESARIEQERYPAPNVCEIVLELDIEPLLNLLKR